MNVIIRIRKFAHDNEIIVKYELLKANIRKKTEEKIGKKKFIFTMHLGRDDFAQHLKNYIEQEHFRFKIDHKISIKKKIKRK
ncbi:MAG: hypothetical protein RSC26_11485 [Terrisporobacter sp.]